ncbi:unnamed protein product [Blepharisma stoltei]|uniref:Ribosomal protein S4 n=1 Tax=Blepharisma stoltei TaxID=1481888 RepID=A0AAU9JCK3_9CILI|nr:unnamed protein product [Blepharisma stoltei]
MQQTIKKNIMASHNMSIAKPSFLSQLHLFQQYQLSKPKLLKSYHGSSSGIYKSLPLLETIPKKPSVKHENTKRRSKSAIKPNFNDHEKLYETLKISNSIEKLPIYGFTSQTKFPTDEINHLSKMRNNIRKAIGVRQKGFPSVKLKKKLRIVGKVDTTLVTISKKIFNIKNHTNCIEKELKSINNPNYASHNMTKMSISAKEPFYVQVVASPSVSDFEDDVYFKSIYN